MKPKKAVKELEKQLRKDPENLVLRLRLAAALREVGRTEQAVTLYRSVAVQYHADGRLSQAVAVCRSVLEIDPAQRETQSLLAELEAMQQVNEPLPSVASYSPPAGGPIPEELPSSAQLTAPARRTRRGTAPAPVSFDDEPDAVPAVPYTPPNLPPEQGRAAPSRMRTTRPVPAVRVLDAAPSRPKPMAPPRDEFHGASGFTPIDDGHDVPSLASSPPPRSSRSLRPSESGGVGEPVVARDSRPPGVPGPRRTGAILSKLAPRDTLQRPPPRMPYGPGSGPLLTPTPLPTPLPSHDADEESITTNPKLEPLLDSLPPMRPLTSETPLPPRMPSHRVEPDDDDAMTTVAPEDGWRPPAVDPVPAPSLPPSLPPEPAPEPAPASHDDVFGEATRFGDSLAEVGSAALRPETAPPAPRARRITRNTLRMGDKPQRERVDDRRMTDPLLGRATTSDTDADEITGVRKPPTARPGTGGFDDEEGPTRFDDQPLGAHAVLGNYQVVDDDDGDLGLVRAFDRSFTDTLRGLAPDGSAIDSPLTIFSELPEDALAELVRRMTLRSYRPGEIVLREGDPGDACFVIATGSVRVLKRDPANQSPELLEVARLGAGSVFGEFALLADRRRHATVQAVEATDLYEVPRRLLRELAASYDDVGPALERFYRERLLSTLLATAPFFAPLEEDKRARLLERFRPQRCESGQRIIAEGQKAGGLFLIVLGSVEITKRVGERRSVLLSTLGEGAYFGELSLMRGGPAQATVTATGPTELAVLPPQDFYELVAANPVLWQQLRNEAHRRELMMRQIVTGESGIV